MTASPVIGSSSLAAALATARPPVLLDVRWTLAGPQHAVYLQGHLPGAVFVDLDADLAGPAGVGGRHPLPDPEQLQRSWRAAGIDADSPVVVYDAADSSVAARCWWLLRWSGLTDVRVLDGGFAGWRAAGLPVQSGDVPVGEPGTVVVHPGGMPTVDIDGAGNAGADGDAVLLDARAAERYRGEVEPVDPLPGHIPGAVNLPLTELVTAAGAFRSPAELAARFAEAGVAAGGATAGSPAAAGSSSGGSSSAPAPASWSSAPDVRTHPQTVASCGSGVTACHLILAGRVIGLDLALYPGSYSGWLAAGRAPVR